MTSQRLTPARLEFVVKLSKSQIDKKLQAEELFDVDYLTHLCKTTPILLPFIENADVPFMPTMRNIAQDMLSELESLVLAMPSLTNSWRAYQLELGLQYFFYGTFLNANDQHYRLAQALGLGCDSSSALKGILNMTAPTSAARETQPPPLTNWVMNKVEQERIKRLFDFSYCAAPAVAGSELILILLKDLYSNNALKIHFLKNVALEKGKFVGGINLSTLVDTICCGSFTYPFTFQEAARMIEKNNLSDVVKLGIVTLGLKIFPAFKSTDTNKNARVNWNKHDYWVIHYTADTIATLIELETEISGEVLTELRKRDVCYASTLACLKESGMIWILPILHRLEGANLSRRQAVIVCSFLTAVILYANVKFVRYDELKNLNIDLPKNMKQENLQDRKILSANHFQGFRIFKLYRPHTCIPHALDVLPSDPKKPQQKMKQMGDQVDQEEEQDTKDEDGDDDDIIVREETLTIPASTKSPWSAEEVSLLKSVKKDKSIREMHREYKRMCIEKHMSIRSYFGFKSKLNRL